MEEVRVLNITGNQVNGRYVIASLFSKDANKYVLDFTDVNFISRSATHELLTKIECLSQKNIKVKLKNLSFSLKRMIKSVESSRKNGTKRATYVNRLNFSTPAELDSFILSI